MRKPPTLTVAQRQARRETIMRTKPWVKATGPKTMEGKATSAKRSRRHGLRSAEAIAAQQWVSSMKGLIRALGRRGIICGIILGLAVLLPANFYPL